jgi:hypothetical protein
MRRGVRYSKYLKIPFPRPTLHGSATHRAPTFYRGSHLLAHTAVHVCRYAGVDNNRNLLRYNILHEFESLPLGKLDAASL